MKILVVQDTDSTHEVLLNWINDLKKMGHEITIAVTEKKSRSDLSSNINNFYSLTLQIINLNNFIKLKNQIENLNPDLVWFHNINNVWSWICLLVPTKKNIKIITLHDLTSIYPKKITQDMLNSHLEFMYFRLGLLKGVIYKLRSFFIRLFLSKIKVVSIGELHNSIYRANGIQIAANIQNYIKKCDCVFNQEDKRAQIVLFAGRENLKGLKIIIESVNRSEGWVLMLAGEKILYDVAVQKLPEDRFHYLGELKNATLHEYIHKVKFVSVLSQYYDNFPTIGLEALVHGAFPITTNLTGISTICKSISNLLVFKVGDIPNLNLLDLEFYSREPEFDSQFLTDQNVFFIKLFSLLD